MAIDGAEITSRVLAERPRLFSAVEALRSALNLGADLLLPPVCISCRKRAGAHGLLCGDCWAGEPLFSAGAIADPPVYDRARAAARYSSTMRDLIQSFKYGDRHEGVPLFGRWMAAAGAELLAGADVIVPVPLYRSRLWSRRFNQSAMLAQEVGKLAGVPVDCFLLARVKRTQAQVGLTAAQRRKNVAGAFRLTAAKGALREKRIVVVDDVITTGATAEACARVLKRAGAARVDILALARAVEPSALLL